MAKIPEAQARLFGNIFICKKCKRKQRSSMKHISSGKVSCRKCGGKAFRAVKKKQ